MLNNKNWILTSFLLSTAVLVALDIYEDIADGAEPGHWMVEGGILTLLTLGASYLIWDWFRNRDVISDLKIQVGTAESDREKWRQEAAALLMGLSASIDQQLERWGMTQAEKDVALLLLKGLSFKEIAEVRQTSERTARQHSLTIYRKSGLSGRAELSAFFLEDLLASPSQSRSDSTKTTNTRPGHA